MPSKAGLSDCSANTQPEAADSMHKLANGCTHAYFTASLDQATYMLNPALYCDRTGVMFFTEMVPGSTDRRLTKPSSVMSSRLYSFRATLGTCANAAFHLKMLFGIPRDASRVCYAPGDSMYKRLCRLQGKCIIQSVMQRTPSDASAI